MTTRSAQLVALLLILSAPLVQAGESTYSVQAVEDGDTLIIEINGIAERVQLLGIDAPESGENPKLARDIQLTGMTKTQLLTIGNAATQYLQTLVAKGDRVTLKGNLGNKDRYGRIPAEIINDSGYALGETMVRQGYAIALSLDNFPDNSEHIYRLERLEQFSRQSNHGLWGSHQRIMRPWYERTR